MTVRDPFAFEGARALVTGASSGIGRATARLLAQRGAHVVISARRTGNLEELAREVVAAGAPEPVVLPADLGRPGEARRLGREAVQALGGLDLLVNNAAAQDVIRLEDAVDTEEARLIYEVNVWSPLALAVEVLPALRQGRRGAAIVNVTSGSAYLPPIWHGTYASSKAAAATITDILRLEIGRNSVHVIEAVPGPVETEMLQKSKTLRIATVAFKILPPGTPEGMAQCIVSAIARRRRRAVYPWHIKPAVALPPLGRMAMSALTAATREGG